MTVTEFDCWAKIGEGIIKNNRSIVEKKFLQGMVNLFVSNDGIFSPILF